MTAVFRILRDVIVYRVRKREMANLASSLTIMIAVGLGRGEIATRFTFALALNLAVYLTNDIYDVDADLASPNKDNSKAQYLKAHPTAAWIAVLIPVLSMTALGLLHDQDLLITLLIAGTVCWAYSARLKRIPFVDLPTILVCGIAGSMLAFPLDRPLGWCLAGLLGLFAACFQAVQMVRDHDDDSAFGTRTTAVALGPRASIALQRVLLAATALYASLVVHRWVGLAIAVTIILPFQPREANTHWNRIRLALGLAWLVIVAWVRWSGSTFGWLVEVDVDAHWPWLSL